MDSCSLLSLLSRRSFLVLAAAAGGAAAASRFARDAFAADAASKAPPIKIPDDHKINGFAIGCQAWTFNRFNVFEAIEKTAKAGGRIIEFYPGQEVRKDQPAVRWGHGAP